MHGHILQFRLFRTVLKRKRAQTREKKGGNELSLRFLSVVLCVTDARRNEMCRQQEEREHIHMARDAHVVLQKKKTLKSMTLVSCHVYNMYV